MHRLLISFLFLSLAALASEPNYPLVPIETPAGANTGEVDLFTDGNTVAMTWIESREGHSGRVMYARYNGKSWSKPVIIADKDNLFINWADMPRVAFTEKQIVVAWLEMISDENPYAYGVRIRQSTDDGQTWDEPIWLHEDLKPTTHGFVSMAVVDESTLAAVWLDGRAFLADDAVQLWSRTITPSGLGPEILVDDSICSCCGTDVLFHDKKLISVYRDKTKSQIRDIYLATIADGKVLSTKAVADDGWEIHGCPVNGPALAASGDAVAVAWFTAAKGHGEVKLAFSGNGGGLGKPTVLSSDAQGRVDTAFLGDTEFLAVTWIEFTEPGSLGVIRIQFFPVLEGNILNYEQPFNIDTTSSGRTSGFPKIAALKDRLLIAYQAQEEKRIAMMAVEIPNLKP